MSLSGHFLMPFKVAGMKPWRRVFQCLTCMLVAISSATMASERGISGPADFQLASNYARERKIPIMVLFSSIYCDYCQFVKEEYLAPMIKSGEYTDKVIIKVVEIDSSDDVRDIDGQLMDSEEFSDRYDVQLTPTVTFIDSQGQELSERIIGIGTEDYYGSFLDEGINTALLIINSDKGKVWK